MPPKKMPSIFSYLSGPFSVSTLTTTQPWKNKQVGQISLKGGVLQGIKVLRFGVRIWKISVLSRLKTIFGIGF